MQQSKNNRIFIDTNVLVYDFLHRNPVYAKQGVPKLHQQSFDALEMFRKHPHYKTYIASFSIARFVSLLQSTYKVPIKYQNRW
ncbi:MAG: hypothetical protein RI894_1429 [Bacteroidota bacterium]|jgi:predicted nucleic acid-binding protein